MLNNVPVETKAIISRMSENVHVLLYCKTLGFGVSNANELLKFLISHIPTPRCRSVNDGIETYTSIHVSAFDNSECLVVKREK